MPSNGETRDRNEGGGAGEGAAAEGRSKGRLESRSKGRPESRILGRAERDAGTVVIVDDEEMVVRSLESFLTLETGYTVRSFVSPIRALEAVREEEIHLVLADFLMPEQDGISFLKAARECQPEATRVLLTGYADKENAIRAINEVGLYQYLEKPWDNQHLKIVMRNGVERSLLFREISDRVSALEEANEELDGIRKKLVRAFL